MNSYRQSSYDPEAYEQPGRPLKPYSALQWAGVALGTVGIALFLLNLAGRLGWMPQWVDDPSPASFILTMIGLALIYSRREPPTIVGEEQRAMTRRILVITLAICTIIFGVDAAIDS